MNRIALVVAMLVAALSPARVFAVAAPANVSVGIYQQNAAAQLYWDEDSTVVQWNIYLGGVLTYRPQRGDTWLTATARRTYVMNQLASSRLPAVIMMRAIVNGAPISSESTAVTLTATVPPGPYTLVVPAPGAVFMTSGGGGGSASSVTVISSVLPSGASTSVLQTTGNSTLTTINSNLSNVTVNAHAVTIDAPTTGQTVAVSGTVTVGTHAVTINAPTTGQTVAVSGNASVNIAQVNGGAVSTGNGFTDARTLRVAVSSDNTPFPINIQSASTGLAVNVSNTVTVGTHAVTINSAASGVAVNVSNTVGTNLISLNGTAVATGNGTAGIGQTQRVVIASDNTAFPVKITSDTTGLAVNVSNTVTANSTLQASTATVGNVGVTNTVKVEGNVASGVATAGNPVGFGGRAATTLPVAVADGQRVEAQFTKSGKLVTMPIFVPELVTRTTTTLTATTTETTILVAGGSGVFWDIDSISVINTDNATSTDVEFRNNTGGAIVYNMGASKAYGGFVAPFFVPLPQEVANNNWTVKCGTSVTSLKVNIVAHQRK